METKNKPQSQSVPSYTPIDVHPNPYGVSKPNAPIDFTQPPPQPETYPMPSRDYPQTNTFANDERIQPNYIPPSSHKKKLTTDFLLENADIDDEQWLQHRQRKYRASKWEQLWDDIQVPIFISVLFFLFQTPYIHNLFFFYLSSFPLFEADGTPNFMGMVVKSIVFGGVYYGSVRLQNYLSA